MKIVHRRERKEEKKRGDLKQNVAHETAKSKNVWICPSPNFNLRTILAFEEQGWTSQYIVLICKQYYDHPTLEPSLRNQWTLYCQYFLTRTSRANYVPRNDSTSRKHEYLSRKIKGEIEEWRYRCVSCWRRPKFSISPSRCSLLS